MTEQFHPSPSPPHRSFVDLGHDTEMIEVHGLSKRYGTKTAVDDLSFGVKPATITGFLGPNGAGKSTTMRLILGLDRPSAGSATIGGKRYRDLVDPLRVVGLARPEDQGPPD